MTVVQEDFRTRCARRRIEVEHRALGLPEMCALISEGAIPIVLISLFRGYGEKIRTGWSQTASTSVSSMCTTLGRRDGDGERLDQGQSPDPAPGIRAHGPLRPHPTQGRGRAQQEGPMSGWIIVVDRIGDFKGDPDGRQLITTRDYIARPQAIKGGDAKVINLSRPPPT